MLYYCRDTPGQQLKGVDDVNTLGPTEGFQRTPLHGWADRTSNWSLEVKRSQHLISLVHSKERNVIK